MTTSSNQSDGWQECPQGSLSRYSQAAQANVRRTQMGRLTMVAASCVLVVGLGYVGFRSLQDGESGTQIESVKFGCRAVKSSMEQFFAGELPETEEARIREHLVHCHSCGPAYEQRATELGVELVLAMQYFAPLPYGVGQTLVALLP